MATQKLKVARLYKDFDMLFTKNALSGDVNKKLDVKKQQITKKTAKKKTVVKTKNKK